MPRQPARDLVAPTTLWERLYRTVARPFAWIWRTGERGREVLGQLAAQREQAVEDNRCVAARARFWDELREGRRQAEANCPRVKP